MWHEILAFIAGFMPLPYIITHVIFALFVGFGAGGLTAGIGFESLAPFVAVFAFFIYSLIAVLAALRHRL
jgi:hypothetical protein